MNRTITGILVFILLSCSKERKCIKSLGDEVTETRPLGIFTQLRLNDKIQVILEPSTTNEAVVSGGENMVDFIETRLEGNTLVIEDLNKCNFLRSYKKNRLVIRLRYNALQKIHLSSAGNISTADTIRTPLFIEGESAGSDVDLWVNNDSLKIIMHTGTSNFTVSGKTKQLELYSGGNGIFHMENLRSDVVLSNNSGTGDFYIFAVNYLFAYLHLTGNIYYKGTTSVDVVEDAKGKLIPLN